MPTLSEQLHRTALRSPLHSRDTKCPPCVAQSSTGLCDHAAVCPCAGIATADSTQWPTSSTKRSKKQASTQRKGRPPPTPPRLRRAPTARRRVDPSQRGFDARSLGVRVSPSFQLIALTQNLTETRRSYGRSTTRPPDAIETASVSHPWVFNGHAGQWCDSARTWSPGFPNDSAPPLTAHPATSISSWLSASLRHFTVILRVPFLTAQQPQTHELGCVFTFCGVFMCHALQFPMVIVRHSSDGRQRTRLESGESGPEKLSLLRKAAGAQIVQS